MKLIVCLLLVVSCISVACNVNPCGDELEDIAWKLKEYGTPGNLQLVSGNVEITIKFNSNDKTAGGSGGCNSYSGAYELKPNCGLTIGAVISTKKACLEDGIMQQEQKYFDLLQNADSFEVVGQELSIICGSEVLVYGR